MDAKPFKNCKIAICLSGQSRTFDYCAESILDFFSSDVGNKFYFFGHTTNKNKNKPWPAAQLAASEEELDIENLGNAMKGKICFTNLLVEEEKQRNIGYGIQLYSQMMANFLKQQYEIENNMMFDVVVRARFDVCYQFSSKLEHFVKGPIQEKTLYSHFGLMRPEFVLPNPTSIIHYGSSLTMDIIDTFFNVLNTGAFYKLVECDKFNPMWRHVGDGALIHKWCVLKNILTIDAPIPFSIARPHSLTIDYKQEWEKFCRAGWFQVD